MKYEASNGWAVRYRLIAHKETGDPWYSVMVYDNLGKRFRRLFVPHTRTNQMFRQMNAVVYTLTQLVQLLGNDNSRDQVDQLRFEMFNYLSMLTLHGPTYAGSTKYSNTSRRIR